MNENERIVCEFLREIAPSREWRYLGEVEHYLIGELCDELNKQLKAENAKLREEFNKMDVWHSKELTAAMAENDKLRELVEDMHAALQAFCDAQDVHGDNCPLWVERTDDCELRGIERRMSELRVEVDG